MKYIIGLVMALMFIPACSGEDAELSPPEKCEALVNKTCSLVSRCGGPYIFDINQTYNLNCNNVIAISSNYNACMEDLDYIKCSDVILPLSCYRVLIYE